MTSEMFSSKILRNKFYLLTNVVPSTIGIETFKMKIYCVGYDGYCSHIVINGIMKDSMKFYNKRKYSMQ